MCVCRGVGLSMCGWGGADGGGGRGGRVWGWCCDRSRCWCAARCPGILLTQPIRPGCLFVSFSSLCSLVRQLNQPLPTFNSLPGPDSKSPGLGVYLEELRYGLSTHSGFCFGVVTPTATDERALVHCRYYSEDVSPSPDKALDLAGFLATANNEQHFPGIVDRIIIDTSCIKSLPWLIVIKSPTSEEEAALRSLEEHEFCQGQGQKICVYTCTDEDLQKCREVSTPYTNNLLRCFGCAVLMAPVLVCDGGSSTPFSSRMLTSSL